MSPTDEFHRSSALHRVRGVFECLIREGSAVARSDGTVHFFFPVAASAVEGEALRERVSREGRPGRSSSALHICEGLLGNADPTPRHVVDPFQATRFADCGLQILDEAGVVELVVHHVEGAQIALPRFLDESRSFHLAFVHGNHRFDGVFLDLRQPCRWRRPRARPPQA